MDLAVPATVLIADASESQFRSGIFSLAISSTCFAVTVPTLVLFGSADPLAMFAARFNSTGAGDDHDALGLAQPVWQHHRAADHLVGVLRVDAQTDRQADRLVELRELELLNQRERFFQGVWPVFDLLFRRGVLLAVSSHKCLTG